MIARIAIVYLWKAMPTQPIPVFARRIFWDVDFDKLDYEGKADFVIERVCTWGDVPDIRQVRRYYGDEQVLAVLLAAENMPSVSLYFWSSVLNRPVTDFKSYNVGEEEKPYNTKRAYFDRLNEIHGLPPMPEPHPAILRMS